jgi:hypothetical protein
VAGQDCGHQFIKRDVRSLPLGETSHLRQCHGCHDPRQTGRHDTRPLSDAAIHLPCGGHVFHQDSAIEQAPISRPVRSIRYLLALSTQQDGQEPMSQPLGESKIALDVRARRGKNRTTSRLKHFMA